MAKLFRITPAIRRLSANAIDTMIDELGKMCLLAYDVPGTECPNCYFDPNTKLSNGVYRNGGPRSFTRPPCPVCRGKGMVGGGEAYREVKFLIDWQPKPWLYVDTTQARVPQGMVQIKGYVKDMGLVKQAKYIIIDHVNANYQNNRFMIWGEPIPQGNIVPNRYFIAFWMRSG